MAKEGVIHLSGGGGVREGMKAGACHEKGGGNVLPGWRWYF